MRRHTILFIALPILIVALSGVFFNKAFAQDNYGSNWEGQYYDNEDLAGSPEFTRTDQRIDFDFGGDSPDDDIDEDNFSIRWTTTENFSPGTYEFVARADDGIRVFINGTEIIDQFEGAAGQTFTAQQSLSGNVSITVEYREFDAGASVEFFWRTVTGGGSVPVDGGPTATPGPTPTPAPTSPPPIPEGALTATVIRASALVVRDSPFLGGNRIGTIRRGETYQVIGRNQDATWFLLNLGDRQGWSFSFYLFIDGNEFSAPIANPYTTSPPPASDIGVVVQSIAVLKLRAEADVNSPQIGRVDWGALIPVTGRASRGSWYQVVWKGTVGWVFSPFTEVIEGDLNDVPIIEVGSLRSAPQAAEPSYNINTPQPPDVVPAS